jgi:hypothetical protein
LLGIQKELKFVKGLIMNISIFISYKISINCSGAIIVRVEIITNPSFYPDIMMSNVLVHSHLTAEKISLYQF